jgi:(2Fe-2S) ferredoxin
LVGDKKGTCHTRGGVALVRKLMQELDERELASEVAVSATSCHAICDKGPIVVVYPDAVWYGGVTEEGLETIVEEHLEGGKPVKALML